MNEKEGIRKNRIRLKKREGGRKMVKNEEI